MGYRIGLDIGIGSIGWAVISGKEETAKIEDFGTRIFDSGEIPREKKRKSQDRRLKRGQRRLFRRRSYRKIVLKNHLTHIGMISEGFEEAFEKVKDADVILLKVKGLDEKLQPEELYKCLIHFCNHRGYKDFYEDSEEQDEESGKNKAAVKAFDILFEESGYRTVSEYLLNEKNTEQGLEYRNRDSRKSHEFLLIHRFLLKEELTLIIHKQREYYDCLNGKNGDYIIELIFRQRIFEEGPGNPSDPFRKYTGFIESLGQCPFYPDEKRGFRSTVISDVYAVVNTLSQYRYKNIESGEFELSSDVTAALIESLLQNANLTMSEVKKICRKYGYEVLVSGNSDTGALGKSIKFLRVIKKSIESSGESWSDYISKEQFDLENKSVLHKIGEALSVYHTPSRRKEELKSIGGLSDSLINILSSVRLSGTSAASYRYMTEAVDAFKNGEIYGNFQSEFNKNRDTVNSTEKSVKLLPKHIDDEDVKNNPVVFRSINETRKVLNEIINIYGSPEIINVEVASDVNRSFDERGRIQREQRNREKENERIKKSISELLGIDIESVTGRQIEIYKLYEIQEGKSLYSCEPLGDLDQILDDKNHRYEVDHIIPYSLILDNTLNNKALVRMEENQHKGQRTPLMYLNGEARENYMKFVNALYIKKKNGISDRKYKYLTLESLYGTESEEILSAWKSRNINDTRYITKYIVALLEKYLAFSGDMKKHVYGVKGVYTSNFRKIWLKGTEWGDSEKNRGNHLNHAVDAIVVANLTPAYLEIASDNIKLNQIYRKNRKNKNSEYFDYLDRACRKMVNYYGFEYRYAEKLIEQKNKVPAYLPEIKEEVNLRITDDEKKLQNDVNVFYKNNRDFVVEPHVPTVSVKPSRRFRGEIADSNPIKLIYKEDGAYQITRRPINTLDKKNMDNVCGNDTDLLDTLKRIFGDKKEEYSIQDYLDEKGMDRFVTDGGKHVYKISLIGRKMPNYYKTQISEDNYSILGVPKYYCIEVYKNVKGETKTWGIRYVDVVKRGKKLLLKSEVVPTDYEKHIMYLYANDLITVIDSKGNVKITGYYKAVKSIGASRFYVSKCNESERNAIDINRNDTVIKHSISILGHKGGDVSCSEPLSLITEKR